MKRSLCIILSLVLAFSGFISNVELKADDIQSVSFDVLYAQKGARSMLDMVNNYRAAYGNEEDDNQYPYIYDYELEKAAMKRAAEIAVKFSNTRPDGQNYLKTIGEFGFDISPRKELYGEREISLHASDRQRGSQRG